MFQTEGRVIEITKLAENPALIESLRANLEAVIRGEFFGKSPRCQQFLRHVVEKSIKGDFDSLKERVIAVELFHRSSYYDKGEDAIVRVTASDVRRRLSQHYGQYGDASEFRIDIPLGSYVLEITRAPRKGSFPNTELAAPQKNDPVESPGPAAELNARNESPFRARVVFLAVPFALLFLAGAFWAGYSAHKSDPPRSNPSVPPWSAILGTGRTLQIIADDADFASEQDITGHAISFSDYANGKYIPDGSALSPEIRSFCLKYLRGDRAGVIDLPIVANIVSLAKPTGQRVVVHPARQVKLADFRTDDDFILLGATFSNPWLEMFAEKLDFKFISVNESSIQEIENVHPRGKELKVYAQTGGTGFETRPPTGTGFAIIALVQNPHQLGHVLILAGTGGEGTEAAAQLVTNVSDFRNVLRNCNGPANEPLRNFEVLLKVSTMAGSATNTEVITCHRLTSQ
jgi:hypothetical protein